MSAAATEVQAAPLVAPEVSAKWLFMARNSTRRMGAVEAAEEEELVTLEDLVGLGEHSRLRVMEAAEVVEAEPEALARTAVP